MNQVEPVYIAVENAGGGLWLVILWWSLAAIGAAIAAWALLKLAPRFRRDSLVSAFSRLARQQRLSAEDRADLKALGARTGIPAAVLLVSSGARAEAARPSR